MRFLVALARSYLKRRNGSVEHWEGGGGEGGKERTIKIHPFNGPKTRRLT